MRTRLLATIACLPLCAALARGAHAQGLDGISMCGGIEGGNYEYAAREIVRQAPGHVTVQTTEGSVDNLDRLAANSCQFGIAQRDAWFLYGLGSAITSGTLDVSRDLYPEYGHLVCNSTINDVSDLKRGDTVLVGGKGSGSSVMWQAFVKANPRYAEVVTHPVGGLIALGKVSDGTDAQCTLFVSGLRSAAMLKANEYSHTASGGLHLVPLRDPALFSIKDARGKPVYSRTAIPDGTYPNGLQRPGWVSSGKPVDTVEVMSVLVVNSGYAQAHEHAYEQFLNAVSLAMPAINNHVLPK